MAHDKIAKREPMEMSETVPDFMQGAEVDESHLNPDDIQLPRLAIAQAMSPQMTPGKSEFLEDLKLYDFFNDITQEIYGKGPIYFVPIVRDVKRMEFDPNDPKIVLDRDVPYGDQRNEWTDDENGQRVKPRATKFVEFIALLLRGDDTMPEPIVISVRQSNKFARKAAVRLTGLIEAKKSMRKIPTYGGIYTASVKPETFPKGTAGVFTFSQAGLLQNKGIFEAAKSLAEQLHGKTIIVNREVPTVDDADDEGGGDASFDPATLEQEQP